MPGKLAGSKCGFVQIPETSDAALWEGIRICIDDRTRGARLGKRIEDSRGAWDTFLWGEVSTSSLMYFDIQNTDRCQQVMSLNDWLAAGHFREEKSTSEIRPQVR